MKNDRNRAEPGHVANSGWWIVALWVLAAACMAVVVATHLMSLQSDGLLEISWFGLIIFVGLGLVERLRPRWMCKQAHVV